MIDYESDMYYEHVLILCQCIYFSENKAIGVMKPGHSFTIEPMISEGR